MMASSFSEGGAFIDLVLAFAIVQIIKSPESKTTVRTVIFPIPPDALECFIVIVSTKYY